MDDLAGSVILPFPQCHHSGPNRGHLGPVLRADDGGHDVSAECRTGRNEQSIFLIDVKTDAKKLYEALLHLGVIVRPMNAYGYPTYIRITVGLPAENQRFVKALATTLSEVARA